MYLADNVKRRDSLKILKPPKLKKRDLFGVISPAGPIADQSRIERGVRYLEGEGFRVVIGKHATRATGYLAGDDQERLSDLHMMFRDKKVKAIICTRGGYGAMRLLPSLDYDLIRNNPKILIGFSDITALQLAFWKKCRLISFHGPMLGVEMAAPMEPLTEQVFWQCLTSTEAVGRIPLPEGSTTLHGGKATGRLVGGNLSLVVSLLGTQYQPELRDSILFIEDSGEEPYRIDRMLTQLRNAHALSRARAVLAGQFTDCVPKDATSPSFTVEHILDEVAQVNAKPFLSGLPFGHVGRKITLPVGLRVKVDADAKTIEYLEPAVR